MMFLEPIGNDNHYQLYLTIGEVWFSEYIDNDNHYQLYLTIDFDNI